MPMKKISTFIFVVKKICNKFVIRHESIESSGNDDLKEDDSLVFSPSDQSVRRIMDFAFACDVIKTKTAGYVEMNLN